MAKERPGVLLYWETFEALENEDLSDRDVRRVLVSMHRYARYREVPDFSDSQACRVAWSFIKAKIDADEKRYEQVKATRKAAAEKRWNDSKHQPDSDAYE